MGKWLFNSTYKGCLLFFLVFWHNLAAEQQQQQKSSKLPILRNQGWGFSDAVFAINSAVGQARSSCQAGWFADVHVLTAQ